MISIHVQELLRKAVSLQRAGKPEQAVAWYARACAQAPTDPLCGMAHASLLGDLGRHGEAEARLRPLAQRHPKHSELWDLWAVTLQRCGNIAEAISASQHAVEADPKKPGAWCNLALAFLNTGRAVESLLCQEKALALDPQCGAALHGRAMALQHLHRIPEAVRAYGEAIARHPKNLETRSYRLFGLHYLSGISREALWEEHRAFGGLLPAASPRRSFRPDEGGRRLRVAFLSPDLREHSVSYFLAPLLDHLDASAFEVYLYHDHYRVDAVSERLKARAANWRNFVGLSHEAVAAQIRADQIDILIDLAGHTGLNRLPVFACRAAPVQMTYLGYPDTTGVPAMDYRLVDAVTDPAGESDRFSSERLIRFATTLWSYQPPQEAGSVGPCRSGPAVFGSCNNLAKVSDETLRGWAGVMAAVPDSHLRLKADGLHHPAVAEHLLRRAAAAGIDPARIETVPRAATIAAHLDFYHGIDVALDTFPYHGTTTTCEALWMGVPVVSRIGDRHCARVGASLLAAIGHSDWACASWSQFAQVAARCAADRPDRAQIRAALQGSALMDHAGQAGRFGAALRQCWSEQAEAGHAAFAA